MGAKGMSVAIPRTPLETVLEALAARGHKPRTSGTGWSAQCPAHPDRNPSLSIAQGNEGVVLHCHAGCDPEDVVTALGLTMRDLFDQPAPSRDDTTAIYNYVDEHGALLFQVVRKPGKQFRQRRPNGDGGWEWKLGDTRRVVYRLPEVIAAIEDGDTVFIVEGEKDADRLAAEGYVATCNPHGAGKWRPEYNATFNGAHVVIVADRDEPGRAHALNIATQLEPHAASIKIVEAAAGKDISDHLAAGFTVEDLVVIDPDDLAQPGTDIDPADIDTGPSSWVPVDLTDALAGVDIPAPEIWYRTDQTPLIYRARVHWFQGESESCKSWAAQTIVAEQLTQGHNVLYIDYEDDDRGVVSRLLALGTPADSIARHLTYIRPDEPLRDRHGRYTDGWVDFADTLETTYRLCVIDGVTEAMTTEGLELNSNTDIAAWMRLLPKRIAATGAAVICIDHVTKNGETQGRYAIGGQHKLAGVTGAAYKFTTLRPLARATGTGPVTGTVAVTVMKDRPGYVRGRSPEGKVGILSITAYPDGGVTAKIEPHDALSVPVDMAIAGRILTYLSVYDGSSKAKIEESVEGKAVSIRAALAWLVGQGLVRVEQKGSSHLHWLTAKGREEVPNT